MKEIREEMISAAYFAPFNASSSNRIIGVGQQMSRMLDRTKLVDNVFEDLLARLAAKEVAH